MTVVVDDDDVAATVARARSGDMDAVGELVARYRPTVFRYCLARLGEREAADDATQETCIAMMRALPRYRDEGRPFVAFVVGIAVNKVAESRRRAGRRREDVSGTVPDTADPAGDPAEAAVASTEAARALRHVALLPRRQQEIVLLRVAGLYAEEVAATLGMTAGAVRVAQHRALTRLRESIGAVS